MEEIRKIDVTKKVRFFCSVVVQMTATLFCMGNKNKPPAGGLDYVELL